MLPADHPSRPIVCGVAPDFDHLGHARYASQLSRRLACELVIAHVASRPTALQPPQSAVFPLTPGAAAALPAGPELEEADAERRARLEDELRRAAAPVDPAARVRVVAAATTLGGLRQVVEEEGAQMLVVASHGKGTVRAALLGSTTHALVTDPPCAVLVAPPERSA